MLNFKKSYSIIQIWKLFPRLIRKVSESMKVLSLIEPWATLIKEGKKVIETRSWKTSYRGELYIHASRKKVKRSDEHTIELLNLIPNVPMGYGNIICKCKLADCVYMDQEFLDRIQKDKQEFLCGEYSLGRYAWILEDVEVLDEQIPAKGHLNIWNYDAYDKIKKSEVKANQRNLNITDNNKKE